MFSCDFFFFFSQALKEFATFFEKFEELHKKLRDVLTGGGSKKEESKHSNADPGQARADLADLYELRRKGYRLSIVHAAK